MPKEPYSYPITKNQVLSDPESCLNKAKGHEPIFVLRAQDVLAIPGVLDWCMRARELGVNPAKLEGAQNVLTWMADWHTQKKPD